MKCISCIHFSTSSLSAAPPIIKKRNLPPKACNKVLPTFLCNSLLIPGVFQSTFISGLLITGNTLPLIIFSITKGTVKIINGCTCANARIKTDGVGALVKKYTSAPSHTWYKNSNIKPNICAIGNILSTLSPAW